MGPRLGLPEMPRLMNYSLTGTLIAFTVVTLIGVGGPLFMLWWDNR
jgi:hypothetical protein